MTAKKCPKCGITNYFDNHGHCWKCGCKYEKVSTGSSEKFIEIIKNQIAKLKGEIKALESKEGYDIGFEHGKGQALSDLKKKIEKLNLSSSSNPWQLKESILEIIEKEKL